MRNSISRQLKTIALAVALYVGAGSFTQVMACPNCKFANETESSRPRAYMYSILFMIGMPATIFTGFGISFYRMVKKSELAQATPDADLGSDGDIQDDSVPQ